MGAVYTQVFGRMQPVASIPCLAGQALV
jgi:hypothetical protein